MFALPNAKRVRREDLNSPSSSRASSPGIDILQKLRAATQFEFETTTVTPQVQDATTNTRAGDEDDEEEELAFNLFAPVSRPVNGDTSKPARPQTIRLRSPTPLEAKDPGFLVPERDQSYYFTGPLSPTKQAQYEASAVTGETIAAWSKLPCPGCAYPWKIISIPASAARKALDGVKNAAEVDFLPEEDREKRKSRLGKKARIKKRIKAEKTRVRKAEAEKRKEEKERLEREKRARRNREKKFKKRARDKAKKAAGGADGGGEGDAKDAEDSDDGSGADSE